MNLIYTYVNVATTVDIIVNVTRVEVIEETRSLKICKSAFVITITNMILYIYRKAIVIMVKLIIVLYFNCLCGINHVSVISVDLITINLGYKSKCS